MRSSFAARWMLTTALVGFAAMSAGCFRSKMGKSKDCRPGTAGCPFAGPTDSDAAAADPGDGPRGPSDGPADRRQDVLLYGDGTRDTRDGGDSPSDVKRDGPSDSPRDGTDARRDVPAERGAEARVCGSREICGNGEDDDCNGLADCFDRVCQSDPSCIDRKKEVCDNGADDDGNGLVDCKDPACFGDKACVVPGREICNNNLDDDDDGLVDCADSDCSKDPSCVVRPGKEICDNGKDDNGDGLVDCTDPQCTAFAACLRAACVPDVDFGAIASSGAEVTRSLTTTGATASFATCASPGGVARVAGFSLAAAADVRLDFGQAQGSAHVVALYRAGAGQSCDQNPVDCLKVGDKPTATQTYNALPPGNYWVIIQSYPGTAGTTTVKLSTGKPGVSEVCDNGKDDDGDGATDCADLDCASASNCTLCVPDVNLGTISIGGGTKTATLDTTKTANRYHPSCGGTSTGNDAVVRFSVAEAEGITIQSRQSGDHVYQLFHVPPAGSSCDSASAGSCAYVSQAATMYWTGFGPGEEYLLVFKATSPGNEGVINISLTAFTGPGIELCNNGIDDDGDRLIDCEDPDCFGVSDCTAQMCQLDGDLGDIDIGTRKSLQVDLASATQVFDLRCGKGDGRGRAYRMNLLSPMVLNVRCTQTGDQVINVVPQLQPLDACDANRGNCAHPAALPSGCNFGIPNLQPGPHFLLVGGYSSGSEGTVDLALEAVQQRVVEICNNGIDDDGDGAIDCNDRKCATDEACQNQRCEPDKNLGLLAIDGTPVNAGLDTSDSGAGDDQKKTSCASGSGGKDLVVSFSLPSKTDLTVKWLQFGNHALMLYKADTAMVPCEAGTPVDCKATAGKESGSYLVTGLAAGKYYLVVDADTAGSEGPINLQLSGLRSSN
jgi:hypothetical protein